MYLKPLGNLLYPVCFVEGFYFYSLSGFGDQVLFQNPCWKLSKRQDVSASWWTWRKLIQVGETLSTFPFSVCLRQSLKSSGAYWRLIWGTSRDAQISLETVSCKIFNIFFFLNTDNTKTLLFFLLKEVLLHFSLQIVSGGVRKHFNRVKLETLCEFLKN